jgi:hypothetical protein
VAVGDGQRYLFRRVDRIARIVTSRPRWVVGAVLAVTLLLVSELRNLRLEVLLSDEVPAGHPYTRIDDRLNERLDLGQTAIVAVGARDGDVFGRWCPPTRPRIRPRSPRCARGRSRFRCTWARSSRPTRAAR